MTRNRRRHPRLKPPREANARVEFGYPQPDGHRCSMPLRDLSPSGLSFALSKELPGLEVGSCIEQVTIHFGPKQMRGDLLLMHMTPDNCEGALCGALFYPVGDEDILTLQGLLAERQPVGADR